jgi:fucokinase
LYTGQTRLAKNLLQRVLRQWAMRDGHVTETVAALRLGAVDMAAALLRRDVAAAGAALSAYWAAKKRMAPMAEPPDVTAMLSVLAPHIHGASLCGAGGGGFAVGFSVAPRAHAALARALSADPRTAGLKWSLHAATVDHDGLIVAVSD